MGGGKAQWLLYTTHLHPLCWGFHAFTPPCNPCVLYWTPGLLMEQGIQRIPGRLSMSHRGHLYRVCWWPMVWGRWCGTRGMMVVECVGWCREDGVGV